MSIFVDAPDDVLNERSKGRHTTIDERLVSEQRAKNGLMREWRRGQDSNLQGLSPGGFQDRFLTIRIPLR
jgi:hypothetical protein